MSCYILCVVKLFLAHLRNVDVSRCYGVFELKSVCLKQRSDGRSFTVTLLFVSVPDKAGDVDGA